MRTLLRRAVLRFDDRELLGADLVLAGLLTGDWQRLERELACGLAADEAARERGEVIDPGRLAAAEAEFREERGLLAADDMRAWLAEHEFTVDQWRAHLARRLRPAPHSISPAAADLVDVEAALRVEATCTGTLARLVAVLVDWCAAATLLAHGHDEYGDPPADRIEELVAHARTSLSTGLNGLSSEELQRHVTLVAELETSFACVAQRVDADDAALAAVVRRHGSEWRRLSWEEVALETSDHAREVAMCVREDGLSLTDAAQIAGTTVTAQVAYADELPAEGEARLASAAPGELVGPWDEDGRWWLLGVNERVAPTERDPEIRKRAVRTLIDDRLARHKTGKAAMLVQF